MSEDNSTLDPTAGILADLESLRASKRADASDAADRDDTRAQLDALADAAGRSRGDADDEGRAPAAASNRRRSRRSTGQQESAPTTGIFFSAPQGDAEDSEEDAADEAPKAAQAAFDLRNPFSSFGSGFAADSEDDDEDEAPAVAAAAPAGGGLLFQAPQEELAEVVDPDWVDDEDDDSEDQDDDSDDSDDSDDDDSRPRRRRRGGRGRRSKRRGDDSGDESARDQQASASDSDDDSDDSDDDSDDEKPSGSSRRRRRSTRRGGDDSNSSDSSDDDSDDEDDDSDDSDDDSGSSRRRRRRSRSGRSSRRESSAADEVTALKGSTRLEAKRQRRREGREAGRRRPVITEAEFLARRESVERTMLVREQEGRTQLVVLEDGIAVEHYLSEKRAQASLIGNVYLGKVQNVLPSMEAAFIDIGKGRNAVLYAGEVNWDALGMEGKPRRIETALKSGDSVLVQVTKDPIGHKGARLTSQISLPGRFLVYIPGNSMTGISRKLPDTERQRLKKLLKEILPESSGVIVRTAAEGASDEELSRDVKRLSKRWETIEKKSTSTKVLAPQLLYSEPDMIVRIIRDVFNEDFSKLVVDGDGVWDTISEYVESVAPDLLERVSRYEGDEDIFDSFRVSEQIEKALSRKVNLPSGGSLVIDRTEAMTVIDVNTGRFTGSGGNLEETVTKNNLEAAEEVIRQMRLRDIGGIIVVDFIDMVLESNRDLVVRRLVECLSRDRTKHQVAEVTSLGLVQMTRKRIGTGLAESLSAAGEDLSDRGLMLPGTDGETGSSSSKGDRRSKKSRRSEKSGGGEAPEKSADDRQREEQRSQSSSAMAAIAKATLKKDDAEAPAESGETAQSEEKPAEEKPKRRRSRSKKSADSADQGVADAPDEQADGGSPAKAERAEAKAAEDAPTEEKPKRRRSRSKKSADSDESAEQTAAESAPQESAPAAGGDAPAEDAEPSPASLTALTAKAETGPAPLMIGAESTTSVQKKAPAEKPARKASPAREEKPAEKQAPAAPSSFLIIGADD